MSESDSLGIVGGGESTDAQQTGSALSMMSGSARPEGLPEVESLDLQETKGKKTVLNQSTMLILVVAVIAAGSLYGMRLTQQDLGATAQTIKAEKRIDKALAEHNKSKSKGQEGDLLAVGNVQKIVDDTEGLESILRPDMAQQQVPVNFVKKNPFIMPVAKSASSDGGPRESRAEQAKRRKQRQELMNELKTFELQSVMQGARPVAIISGELVQPGQTLGRFMVKEIRDVSVDLEYNGEIFQLAMEDPSKEKSTRLRGR